VEIVGVVSDAAVGNIREPHALVLFRPLLQDPQRAVVPNVEVRAHAEEAAISGALTESVAALGHHFVRHVFTLEEQVDQALLRERLIAALSACFAGIALLLACVGIYGLIACAVARRTREIGIRMALGASRSAVLGTVLREAISIVLIGIAAGVPCAFGGAQFVRSFLYGLDPADPRTLLVAAGLFLVIGASAGLWPAYRASTSDPMMALRDD
jgi:predicted lysophospholipase L1 biosynthesis ABC-type transport system permease subunit